MPKINQAGLELIKSFEGCRLEAYDDGTGVWTIGYGHTPATPGQTISQDEADELLESDLSWAEKCVNDNVSRNATPNQFAAMVSLTFNIGCGAFSTSTVLREFNDDNMDAAKSAFGMWVHAGGVVLPGLVRRRTAEAQLFGTP